MRRTYNEEVQIYRIPDHRHSERSWIRRAKYGGMDVSMMKRMKELEEENRRLKKMYAEEHLKAEIIQEAMAKKW